MSGEDYISGSQRVAVVESSYNTECKQAPVGPHQLLNLTLPSLQRSVRKTFLFINYPGEVVQSSVWTLIVCGLNS